MGSILRGVCSKCGYQAELFTGGGLLDCNAETALAAAPGDDALARALKAGARFQIDRDPALCKRCQRIFTVPYVTYWPPGGESRHTAAACPVCAGLLTRYRASTGTVPCPVCGQDITLSQTGHWD